MSLAMNGYYTKSFPNLLAESREKRSFPQSRRMLGIIGDLSENLPSQLSDNNVSRIMIQSTNTYSPSNMNTFYRRSDDIYGVPPPAQHIDNSTVLADAVRHLPVMLQPIQRNYSIVYKPSEKMTNNLLSKSVDCLDENKPAAPDLRRRFSEVCRPTSKINGSTRTISYRLDQMKHLGYRYDPVTPTASKTSLNNDVKLLDKNGNDVSKSTAFTAFPPVSSTNFPKTLKLTLQDICKYEHKPKIQYVSKQIPLTNSLQHRNIINVNVNRTLRKSNSVLTKGSTIKKVFTVRTNKTPNTHPNSMKNERPVSKQEATKENGLRVEKQKTFSEENVRTERTRKVIHVPKTDFLDKNHKNYCDKSKTEMIIAWLKRVEQIQSVEGKYPCACVCRVTEDTHVLSGS